MRTLLHFILILALGRLGLIADVAHTNRVTAEFLVGCGFVQSKSDTNLYTLGRVTLKEAAKRLGFPTDQMRPTTSQSIHSDTRIVQVRDHFFVIRSQMRDAQGRVVSRSLDKSDALCSVTVSLVEVSTGKLTPKRPQPESAPGLGR